MKKLIKSIYNYIPFKKQLFDLLKLIWTPSENIYKHLHFKGIIPVKLIQNKSFNIHHYGYQIENELYWAGIDGGWEKISLNLWQNLSLKSAVVLDIGANTGLFSLITKSLNSESIVYAFEPVERVFEKFESNCKLNNFDIKCEKLALSNNNGEATIFDLEGEDHVYSVTINKNLNDPNVATKEVLIKTKRLDTFIEENKINQIDLIKLDVETHEPEVLEGMGKYLELFQPTFLIEILDDEVGAKVESIVSIMNYLYFNIDEKKAIRKVEHITKSDYYNYLLCSENIARDLKLIS
jgi:FkbM family methyltransferase